MPAHNAKPRPSEKELERMYHGEGLTQKAIAEKVGVTATTIKRWMREAHIQPRKTREEQQAERRKRENGKRRPNAAELRHMYHEEQLTQRQIAKRVGYSYSMVKRWFDDYGIPRRASGWGERQRTQRLDDKAKPAALILPGLPNGNGTSAMEPDTDPFPTPGKRGTRKAVRPWQRLTSVERGIVAKNVDDFLLWVGKKREEEEEEEYA